jgi:RNA polymerase sigma-B factor
LCVEDLMAKLPPREREIVALRFFDGETEARLAERFGVSQSYMSRILKRTLKQMQREAERVGRPGSAGLAELAG